MCLREVRNRIYIIYVNKTAIRVRCLIYWRGSRVGLFSVWGKRRKKKKIRETSKTSCETDRKGNHPCINPSRFQSEKWQPPRDGAKRTIFACARLRGYLVSLRDFSAGNWPAAAVPAFLTAIWHGKHYVTQQTPCCVFLCIFYFPHFFFFFSRTILL